LKISIIGTRGFPKIQGGVEKHCESIYPFIAEMGHEVKVFRRKPYLNKQNKLKKYYNVTFCDLWTFRNKYFETIIHSIIASIICLFQRPDIVHIHNIGPSLILPLLKLGRLSTVVTYHSANYKHNKWGKIAKKILMLGEIFAKKMADKVIYISKAQAGLSCQKKMIYIPNGVNIPIPAFSSDFISKIGTAPYNYIFTVGRFTPEKGLHDLINAFKAMNCSYKLVIVGNADYETKYSKNLRKMAAEDSRILLTGYIDGEHLSQIYTYARLFILPSYNEGLSIALLEALSYGLSVLVSDIPANKELALSPEHYFKCGNIKELQRKIQMLIKKQLTEIEVCEKYRLIINNYNWLNITKQIMEVYEEIVTN